MIKHAHLYKYLEEVGSYLPLSRSESIRITKEMEAEYFDVIEESKEPVDPVQLFGDARMTASNIMQATYPNPEPASLGIRTAAYLFDTTIIGAFLTLFFAVPFFALKWEQVFNGPYDLWNILYITAIMIYSLGIFAVGFSFYFIPEKLYGQSIGKRIFGLYVVDMSGIKITWKQAIVRNITKFTEGGLPLDVIAGWLLRKEGQGLTKATDMLAETKVVRL